MPNEPSPDEIAFAQMRKALHSELSPYFIECADSPEFHILEMHDRLETKDGERPRNNTIKGQSLVTSVRLRTTDQVFHELILSIQHTEDWKVAVTVHSNADGPRQTIIIREHPDDVLPELKKLIDSAFNSIR